MLGIADVICIEETESDYGWELQIEYPVIFECGCEGIYDVVQQQWVNRYSAPCSERKIHATWWAV